jgi:hypothetical protein
MPAYNKIQQFVEDLAHKVHNLGSDSLKIMLTDVAPDPALNEVKANLTEIAAGNGYVAGGSALTVTQSQQAGGTYKLVANDVVFTASGGAVGPFRYAVLYNDTPAAPADPLIGFWDYGADLTLNDGESFTVDLDQTNGVFTFL